GGVLDDFLALDDVGVFQAHFAAGFEPEEFRRRHFGKIIALDEEFAAERNFAPAGLRRFGIVDGVQFLGFAFGITRDDDLEGTQHGEPAQRALVQVVADGVFQNGNVGDAVVFRDADVVGKIAQRLRRDSTTADAADRGHARIVPAGDEVFVHELHEL